MVGPARNFGERIDHMSEKKVELSLPLVPEAENTDELGKLRRMFH